METPTDQLKDQFTEGLRNYLHEGGEEHLTRAYDLGRQSLQDGFSELDIIALYHEALKNLVGTDFERDSKELLDLASAYLIEWLAPFEVRLRSYRNLIDELNEKNDQLEEEILHRREVEQELQQSKNYFQALIENAQDIITVLDFNGNVRYNSPAIERILGYGQNELLKENAFDYVHPDDLEETRNLFLDLIESPNDVVTAEFRFKTKKGDWVHLDTIAKHVEDNPEGPVIIVNSRDATERKKAIHQLRESEAQLSEAQQIAKVGSWEWRPGEESGLHWSDEMCRIYGLEPDEFDYSFETFMNHIHPDDREMTQQVVQNAMEKKEPFTFENKIVRPDGEERVLLCRGQVILDKQGEITKMIGTGLDITEQKEREQKLREYSDRLRRLSARIERAREEERLKIAREVHDELGQMLTVLKMDVSMLGGQIAPALEEEVRETFNSKTGEIKERIDIIIKSVQRITTELRPEVLDNLGLKKAIEWKADEFEQRTGMDINFTTNVEKTDFLDDEQATTLFRIFQEALTNIIRHAMASRVEISLERKDSTLILVVQDNGVGITREGMEASSSHGIHGIRERAQFLNGEVNIEGREGQGTTITLNVPVEDNN